MAKPTKGRVLGVHEGSEEHRSPAIAIGRRFGPVSPSPSQHERQECRHQHQRQHQPYATVETAMLCQACTNLINWKSTRWKGSHKATFGLGGGSEQPASTESTTLDPEADSSDDVGGFFYPSKPSDDADSHSSVIDVAFDPSKPGGFVHHLSGRAFLAAAQQGCQLCLLLVSRLSPEQKLEIARESEEVDVSSEDYDYMVGCVLSDRFLGPGAWEYKGCYNPQTLHLKNGPIYFEAQFFASKSVLCPFLRPLTPS